MDLTADDQIENEQMPTLTTNEQMPTLATTEQIPTLAKTKQIPTLATTEQMPAKRKRKATDFFFNYKEKENINPQYQRYLFIPSLQLF